MPGSSQLLTFRISAGDAERLRYAAMVLNIPVSDALRHAVTHWLGHAERNEFTVIETYRRRNRRLVPSIGEGSPKSTR